MTTTTHDDKQLKSRAKDLGLYGLLAHFDELKPSDYDLVARLLQWEQREQKRRSLERRLKNARLGAFKQIADFDWSWPKRCDRQLVEELMTLHFVAEGANAVFIGPNGVGKSTIAKNVAYQALLAGHTVRFVSASQMLNDLAAQESAAAFGRRLAHYARPAVLCIDELGYLSYDNRHADLLFEVVSRRYEAARSTVVTTNRPFSEWGDVFPNAACVVTLVDRLMHKADIVQLDGQSYRLKEARERSQRRRGGKSRTSDKSRTSGKSRATTKAKP
jgi:DNA replication protein DnaC